MGRRLMLRCRHVLVLVALVVATAVAPGALSPGRGCLRRRARLRHRARAGEPGAPAVLAGPAVLPGPRRENGVRRLVRGLRRGGPDPGPGHLAGHAARRSGLVPGAGRRGRHRLAGRQPRPAARRPPRGPRDPHPVGERPPPLRPERHRRGLLGRLPGLRGAPPRHRSDGAARRERGLRADGAEYPYYRALQEFGYDAAELRSWIPAPAHQAWWLLQNMSGFGGPVSEQLIEARAALGGRIARHLRSLGMAPVLPGYFGTVPPGFAARNPGRPPSRRASGSGSTGPTGWTRPARSSTASPPPTTGPSGSGSATATCSRWTCCTRAAPRARSTSPRPPGPSSGPWTPRAPAPPGSCSAGRRTRPPRS